MLMMMLLPLSTYERYAADISDADAADIFIISLMLFHAAISAPCHAAAIATL